MNGKNLSLGIVQMRCSESPESNLEHALEMTEKAASLGARVVCLPELFRSLYFCQEENATYFDLAETIPGPTTTAFEDLAKRLNITILVSLFEQRAAGLYHNTLAVIEGKKGVVGIYRKMHIPDDPKYYEKFYFTPGDLGFKAFETEHANLGTLICWDQWFPEAARLTALLGAEVIFYPTAIGWHPEEKNTHGIQQHNAWEMSMRAHAVANGCFVVAVNRTGFEQTPGSETEGIQFWGQSFIAAPDGRVLFRASQDEEAHTGSFCKSPGDRRVAQRLAIFERSTHRCLWRSHSALPEKRMTIQSNKSEWVQDLLPSPTPRSLGYQMPPEWAQHKGTWLSWPHNTDTWAGYLSEAERALAEVVSFLCQGEEVHINVLNDEHKEHIARLLQKSSDYRQVHYHNFPTNDAWCRDHGAVFLTRPDAPRLAAVDWGFNAWGEKYPPFDLDNMIPQLMSHSMNAPCFETSVILEGGSIEVNGSGTLMTTSTCLLNPNRNPELGMADLESVLQEMLGADQLIWLAGELEGDDTDGHIDNLARFVT